MEKCKLLDNQTRGSIVVSISACHAEDPGSIPGRGVIKYLFCLEQCFFFPFPSSSFTPFTPFLLFLTFAPYFLIMSFYRHQINFVVPLDEDGMYKKGFCCST